MDYLQEARYLVKNLKHRLGPSPYDIAWLARLREPGGLPRWPDLMEWLLDNQHADGSWGGKIVYYHDRIICTLIAAIALQENGQSTRVRQAIRKAERYLWHHLQLLPRDPFELVGFELIFPTLLDEARSLNLDVPTHTCGYGELQTAKLRLIPTKMLYSPKISTVHSLEFLGEIGDPQKLGEALAINGSLGNSPAATAYYLLSRGQDDERALAYLEEMQREEGHVVYLHPFGVFELAWVLNNLAFSGLPVTEFADQTTWNKLLSEMGPEGVGLDPTFGIPDADTTSVCVYLLLSAGYPIPTEIMTQFEDREKRIFRTYHYERNPSVSTNVHALETLNLMTDYPRRQEVKEQIVLMLLANRKFNIYWTDKWHSSPYYATAHALIALLKEGDYLAHACHHTVDWIIHTQHKDGSWGFFQIGTAEETAYALTALLHYNRYRPIDPDIFHRGASYLAKMHATTNPKSHPELWLGKDLYIPYDIVQSVILSALILYKQTFGRTP